MPSKITIAAAQILTRYDIDENLIKIEKAIDEAARRGCRIVAFHEGCLSGYRTSPDVLEQLDLERLGRAEAEVVALAGQKKISVLMGSVSCVEGRYYNDVLIVDESGTVLGRYAKTWRAGEQWFEPGAGPVIFTVSGIEATTIVCHDLRYPELTRLAAAAGARIVFIVNNESGLSQPEKLLGYRSMQIARGTENMIYSMMINSPCDPDYTTEPCASHGNSLIADPLGNVMDEAGWYEERLVVAEIDPQHATRATALRTLGKGPGRTSTGRGDLENAPYTRWMREGVKMVRRLEGGIR